MVCIYCGHKTQVRNSRYQKGSGRTWRRRQCESCRATVTTYETINWSSALLVQDGGQNRPFSAQKHVASLQHSLSDAADSEEQAYQLSLSIIKQLLKVQESASVSRLNIANLSAQALKRYDYRAYLRYIADHPILGTMPRELKD